MYIADALIRMQIHQKLNTLYNCKLGKTEEIIKYFDEVD